MGKISEFQEICTRSKWTELRSRTRLKDTATSKEELNRAAFYLQTFFNRYSEKIMRTIE